MREERDLAKRKEKSAAQSAAAQCANKEAALAAYDKASRPTMPASKAERRYLARGLKERGEELRRFGSDNRVPGNVILPPSSGCTGSRSGDKRVFTFSLDSDDD